jgi:cbb3-type cytochrome oxidase subunit 3
MFKQVVLPFVMANFMLIGELLFVAIFTASLLWVYRRGSKETYDRLARMPYEDQGERQ